MKSLEIQIDRNNVEQQMAFDIVANTNTCLFITGKAGTGKTTFVKRIQEEIKKNFIVLAPTGIAAINVGGETIHSFFGLPLEVIGPHTKIEVSLEKKSLLENVDTIIIDEASMVRSDMVDAMDRYLRAVFCTHMPFAGKQIVFVGDLYQLPPVVKRGSADEEMLNDLYGTGVPFFYKAHVLKRMNLPKIEFRKIYRQNDADFVRILNKIRIGETKKEDLEILNQHICNTKETKDYSVTLTAFNNMAISINEEKLDEIEAEEFIYEGKITGDFKRKDFPVPDKLRLKVGAQVIFCRNDYMHGCANGTIAKVVALTEKSIKVKLENGSEFEVDKVTWESKERVYNRESRKIESKVVGAYSQYPLKLAWAITIHKSQGMTFDRMHLDLTRGTFAPGQAYVAISRMRSLEGLTLSNAIMPHHITINPEVRAFANSFNDVEMINDELKNGKMVYKHLAANDYDLASQTCLEQVIEKTWSNDYRNAALIAKKMFDIMLDDTNLLGLTEGMELLKDCSMTCNFLNAVFCLYGNRYEEAVGYANMVLSRRICLEAMFIKARALYELERYDEAYDINYQMITAMVKSEEKRTIDKKQYLFEAKINTHIGNSNIAICKRLIKLCPECIAAYTMLRNDVLKENKFIEVEEEEENIGLVLAFNNPTMNAETFEKVLLEIDKSSKEFQKFKRKVAKIAA